MRALKRIKWLNVLKIIGFIGCLALIVHDLFMVTVYGQITSNMVGWTWFGFATFVAALMTAGTIFDDLEEQWNAIETKKERAQARPLKWNILLNIHSIIIAKNGVLVKGGGKYQWKLD